MPAFLLDMDFDAGYKIAHMISTYSVVMSNVEAQNLLIAYFINNDNDPIQKLKETFHDKHPEICGEIQDVIDSLGDGATVMELVNKYGKACALPGALQGALASFLSSHDFKSAVRSSIKAGGGNCGRAGIIGKNQIKEIFSKTKLLTSWVEASI